MTSGDDIDAEQHDLNELFDPKWWYRDLRMAKTSKPVQSTLHREKRAVLVKRGFLHVKTPPELGTVQPLISSMSSQRTLVLF